MSNFKPSVHVQTESYGKSKIISYKTYRELRKNLRNHLAESYNNQLTVSRSLRGEWGEWFENWGLNGKRPYIIKQGWM